MGEGNSIGFERMGIMYQNMTQCNLAVKDNVTDQNKKDLCGPVTAMEYVRSLCVNIRVKQYQCKSDICIVTRYIELM